MSLPTSLVELLVATCPPGDESVVIVETRGTWTRADLRQRISELTTTFAKSAQRRVGLCLPASLEGLAAMAACDALGCLTYLVDPLRTDAELQSMAEQFQWSALLCFGDGGWCVKRLNTNGPTEDAGVVILTSGTEGPPKAVRHSWSTLLRTIRSNPTSTTQKWLLAFRMHLYAGLQVLGQCLANRGCLVIPASTASPEETVGMMRSAGTTHASATPSYWRRLVLFADPRELAQIPLVQITLGGEAADQAILDDLRRIFPHARISHIYATTELGRCFSVSDAVAGFPENFLQAGVIPGVELHIRDGELWGRSTNAMSAAPAPQTPLETFPKPQVYQSKPADLPWIATGDLVTIRDHRVEFVGRKSELINVGGNKVHPVTVENVLREIEGVQDAFVFARSSSIAGSLVACQIVMRSDQDPLELRQRILATCGQCLQRYEIPRILEFVATIELSAAGKRQRLPSVPPPDFKET